MLKERFMSLGRKKLTAAVTWLIRVQKPCFASVLLKTFISFAFDCYGRLQKLHEDFVVTLTQASVSSQASAFFFPIRSQLVQVCKF